MKIYLYPISLNSIYFKQMRNSGDQWEGVCGGRVQWVAKSAHRRRLRPGTWFLVVLCEHGGTTVHSGCGHAQQLYLCGWLDFIDLLFCYMFELLHVFFERWIWAHSMLPIIWCTDWLTWQVGGFDGSTGLNSAEVYDSKAYEWRMIAPMSTRRSSVGVGVVLGCLYAVSLSCTICCFQF